MVAIVEPLSLEEVTSLTAIHASLYEREGYWPKHLEGSYAPAAALRPYELNQPPWHYLDNGSLQFELSNHDNTNIVRWSLRIHRIVLAGTPVSELVDEVTPEMLKDEIGAVIRGWGDETRPDGNWPPPLVQRTCWRIKIPALPLGRRAKGLSPIHPWRPIVSHHQVRTQRVEVVKSPPQIGLSRRRKQCPQG
jgi:hypothetical protein